MKKADVLFLLVGTNPMPNIISALTRVRDNGRIYLLHTDGYGIEGTEDIAFKLEELISNKKDNIEIYKFSISRYDIKAIDDKLKKLIEGILEMYDYIELNYTGGTKIMSSTAYDIFYNLASKNKNKKISLTYFDNEKREFIAEIFHLEEKHIKTKKMKDMSIDSLISVKDIIKLHFDKLKSAPCEVKNLMTCTKIVEKLLNKETAKDTLDLLDKYYTKVIYKKLNELSKREDLFSEVYEILGVEENYESLGFSNDYKIKEVIEYFKGFWFEDYILNILIENKQKWGISDIETSVKKGSELEIDIVFLKDNIIYFISVSTINYLEGVLNKLYEVNYRVAQLSADSGKIGLVSLYSSSEEIKRDYMKIGKNEKDYMIVQLDKLNLLEQKIEEWISR